MKSLLLRSLVLKSLVIALFTLLLWPAKIALADDPVITITLSTNQTAPGDLFMAPSALSSETLTPSLLILDNQGNVIYRKRLLDQALDFKRLPNGLISYFYRGEDLFKLMDARFQEIGEVHAVGYPADGHDLQLSPDGQRYLLMVYRDFQYDMSQIVPGGHVTATVTSCLIQEVDKANKLLWSWDSWDHTPITHTNRSLTSTTIDYDHCNSLAYDFDGHILVSSRHLDSITKINRTTGEIIWRLGGVANDFTFTNDAGFALQHDARRQPDGHLTIFDNGTPERGYSRAVEYEINETTKTITRTWEYTGSFAGCCGNVQRLPNGNTLINWGPAKPSVTEVKPNGTKVFELTIDAPGRSYRSFRFPVVPPFFFPVIFK